MIFALKLWWFTSICNCCIVDVFFNRHDNKFLGLTNEAAWAFNFSSALGEIDHEVLLEYPNINPDGMVIKTETYKSIGGYKPSMKLTFIGKSDLKDYARN